MLLDRARSHEKIEMLCCNVVTKINGSAKVESATLRDLNSSTEIDLPLDGVFIFIGYNPNTALVPKDLLDEAGQVGIDMSMSTPMKGLFAAGDIRSHSKRQIVMAAADGATAAMSAYEYLTHV
jgi:thioredoxin reductase (NADPH)